MMNTWGIATGSTLVVESFLFFSVLFLMLWERNRRLCRLWTLGRSLFLSAMAFADWLGFSFY